MASAIAKVEASYEVPFLAHATMEPMNGTVHFRKDACEFWIGSQAIARVQAMAAKAAGLPPEKVIARNHLIGGGSGRIAPSLESGSRAWPTRHSPSIIRSAAFLAKDLNLANACSMGLRSARKAAPSMGRSSTLGATIRSWRRRAMNVKVFQWPRRRWLGVI
jgi:hypothetical protein